MDLPSTSASWELVRTPVACRLVRLKSRAEFWMTFSLGRVRSRSLMLWADEAAMTSAVTTSMMAGALTRVSETLEALSTNISSQNRLGASHCFSSGGVGGSWATALSAKARRPAKTSRRRVMSPPSNEDGRGKDGASGRAGVSRYVGGVPGLVPGRGGVRALLGVAS